MSEREHRREHRTLEHIEEDLDQIVGFLKPRLAFIKIVHGDNNMQGPIQFTAVGQKSTLTVLGFDQNGAAFPIDFTANPVTWVDDNQAAASDAPTPPTDTLTAVAAGVSNITATCGGFSDVEQATVPSVVPVLSGIKIDHTVPA